MWLDKVIKCGGNGHNAAEMNMNELLADGQNAESSNNKNNAAHNQKAPMASSPEAEVKAVEEVPGKVNTTPEPENKDTQYMTKDLSGGINKIKKQYRKEYPGDNPMAVEKTEEEVQSSIKETLLQAYQDFKKKD